MKKNNGFSSLIIIILVLILLLAGLVYVNFAILDNPANLPDRYGSKMMQQDGDNMKEENDMQSPEPVSDDTSTDTIEAELNATTVGELDGEFDDADSSLNEL